LGKSIENINTENSIWACSKAQGLTTNDNLVTFIGKWKKNVETVLLTILDPNCQFYLPLGLAL
jgi:hypothetical protein